MISQFMTPFKLIFQTDSQTSSEPGAELWAGLDGPGPAHIDSWPAQSEIKK